MANKQIGIIGAGIMAAGMAQNFLKHNYTVHMCNRSAERLEPLLKAGARQCATPREVTERADIVIECVSDDEASKAVWQGDNGILAGATADKALIASSSLSIPWTDELASLCAQKGLRFLDMPLTGSRAGAENGTLRLIIGGHEAVLESIRQDLEAVAEKIYYFGPAGSGMRFKLVLNTLIGIHVNAAAQAAALAERAGLDLAQVEHALFDGSMGPSSPSTGMVFKNKDMPAERVNFAVQWLAKDLGYARQMANMYGVDFDLLNDSLADFNRAAANGLAEQDTTKILQMYR